MMTAEQVKALEPYEGFFNTAIRSRYARYPGEVGIKKIYQIYSEVTKTNHRLNAGCSNCIFRLLVDCGTIYFQSKAALEAEKPKTRKRKKDEV